ncbi:MAG: DegT/DnrJ/EryC1/StrS family aminotransferase [Syntrophomonadaceae bacterium]|jgi:pyridoxal phosphate-dependent aminotransferase EpsN
MQTNNKRIYLSPPHMSGKEQEYIKEAFDTNWIAPLGPHVTAFENEVAAYAGTQGALALSSGTAGLHLALRLLGVGAGDRVFCSSLTFIGSVNPILYQGAIPVFIDSEPDSWNMSPAALEKAFEWAMEIGIMPRAIVIVDLYGQSADYDPLLAICNRYGVPVVEDSAEAMGASYKGKACGTFGNFGVYSFNGNKIITTSGGGMLISDDVEALGKALFWATQARDKAPWYQHSEVGYNYRMSNIVAAVGRGQLTVLDERVKTRREIFARYQDALGDLPGVGFMAEATYGNCNRWLTIMTLDRNYTLINPMQVINALAAENIESRPVWKPMHMQPLFADNMYFTHEEEGSVSDRLFSRGVCLPSGSSLTEEEQERVIEVVRNTVSRG